MIDVKKLCENSHRISKDKGWLEGERSFAGVIALIHSELSEALEEYRDNKPIGEVYYEVSYHHPHPAGGSDGATNWAMSARELGELRARPGVEIKKAKPCGIPSELADVIIRIAQHCGTEGRGLELSSHVEYFHENLRADPRMTFEECIAFAHLDVALSFKSSVKGEAFPEVYDHLAAAWVLIEGFCKTNDINLETAIIEKQAFNETRPHRHGGKKI